MSEYKDIFGEDVNQEKPLSPQVKPVTYVGFIWDHSGSMSGSDELARTNFNEQLATLKKDSDKIDYRVTIIEFDNEVKEVVVNRSIDDIKSLEEYWLGGSTALYDAVAIGMSRIDSAMQKDKREDKAALVIVMTDGYENSSTDYDDTDVKAMIEEKSVVEMEATDDSVKNIQELLHQIAKFIDEKL